MKKVDIKKSHFTKRQKGTLLNKVFKPIILAEAEQEFANLRRGMCNLSNYTDYSRVGNKTVDYFTRPERMDTEGKSGMSYFDFMFNKSHFLTKPYIVKYLANNDLEVDKALLKIYQMYFGSVNIFKPLIAMEIYCKFKPTSVLDFTMGWGGRLVGAAVLNIPNYIGVDMNQDLRQPYTELVNFLADKSSTKATLFFKDALSVDYSKLNYDMVLTSPPYYNVEIYKGTTRKSKDEWDNDFYDPIIRKTYAGLKKGGWYCLNIPKDVYERVAFSVLGKPTRTIPLKKGIRGIKDGAETYGELIYCWKK